MTEHHCKRCGGELRSEGTQYVCIYCGTRYDTETVERHTATLQQLFDAQKQERIHNLRRVLYDAVTATYISRTDVKNACDSLREYLPDDFAANLYRTVCGQDARAVNQAIRGIDPEANYLEMETAITFLVKSLSENTDCLMATSDLIERAYKRYDLKLYNKYINLFNAQAELVEEGVFVTDLPRDVFVAYSSKDMAIVTELVEALEEQGISCFVAARNLRHGVGSVENYDAELKKAMDACRSVVFVSSMNARNLSCDALTIELPYIQNVDKQNGPAEYYNFYDKLPHKYKKPRVEYRIEESSRFNIADKKVDLFFAGYERVYDVESVIERVAEILYRDPTFEVEARRKEEEEARRRAEEDARLKMEAEARLKIEEETRRKIEDETRRKIEAEARRKAEEEARRKIEAEARRKAEEEARRKAEEEARRKAAAINVGSTLTLGSYEQNPGKGKEPIKWQVLAKEGDRALIISKDILDCQKYDTEDKTITWENCTLRKWLNSSFLNAAFSSAEQSKILSSRIRNPKNAEYGTDGGNDTTDRIFCLSIDEAETYFSSDEAMTAKATASLKAKGGIYVNNDNDNSWWWLRSPGSNASRAADVGDGGGVGARGDYVYINSIGVRPALWINLKS